MDWFDRKDNELQETWLEAIKDYRDDEKLAWDSVEADKEEEYREEYPYWSEDRKQVAFEFQHHDMYGIEQPSKAFFRIGQMIYDLERTQTDSIILLFTHARVYEVLRWYIDHNYTTSDLFPIELPPYGYQYYVRKDGDGVTQHAPPQ